MPKVPSSWRAVSRPSLPSLPLGRLYAGATPPSERVTLTSDLILVSATGRTDLDEQAADLFSGSWPELIFHDLGVKPFLSRQAGYFADRDFYALDPQVNRSHWCQDRRPDP